MKYINLIFTDEEYLKVYKQKTEIEMPEQGTIKKMNWKKYVVFLSEEYKKNKEEKK